MMELINSLSDDSQTNRGGGGALIKSLSDDSQTSRGGGGH